MLTDTIAAIATGMTDAGISIIRISGEDAIQVADRIFKSKSGKKLQDAKTHTMHFGVILNTVNDNSTVNKTDSSKDHSAVNENMEENCGKENAAEEVDEVLVSVMRAPKSYTGENTVEINCHGGMYLVNRILSIVLKNGARLAEPGEFTKRAFLNGKMDLSKAEAVMDLISSKNDFAAKNSMRQLKGSVLEKIKKLREKIIYEIAYIESALDDPEHFDLSGYPEELHEKTLAFLSEIQHLRTLSKNGRIRKDGIQTVIVGKPNAGKSSFLNLLSGEERAIVTSKAGTTRDILEETVRIGDVILNVVDTAGIRNTEDEIEQIGVEKAKKYAAEADLILYMVDASEKLSEEDENIISILQKRKVIVLLNKSDLDAVTTKEDVVALFKNVSSNSDFNNEIYQRRSDFSENSINNENSNFDENKDLNVIRNSNENSNFDENKNLNSNINSSLSFVTISAKEGQGLEEFTELLHNLFYQDKLNLNEDIVITNLRQLQELSEAEESLKLVIQSIEDGMPEDFYSIDLQNAYLHLGFIIGEEMNDDVVDEIFSKFCMGK